MTLYNLRGRSYMQYRWLSQMKKGSFKFFFSTSRGCAGRNMRSRTTLRASSDSPCCSESKTLKHDSVQPPRPELYAIPLTKSDEKREFQIFFSTSRGCAGRNMRSRTTLRASSDSPQLRLAVYVMWLSMLSTGRQVNKLSCSILQ